MDTTVENDVEAIVRFVTAMFSPVDVWVRPKREKEGAYSIIFYFWDIDEKFNTNPQHRDIKELKEKMFARHIRKYVQDFLGIKTSGLQPPDFLSTPKEYPITIVVTHAQ